MNRHPRHLADERGIALIAALLTLFIASLLAAAAVAVAMQTNGFARNDVNRKNALEAAEAGLQVALYRINMLQPSASNCVGDTVGAPASDGWCASSTTTLANGSSYTYYTTPVITANGACAGNLITNADVNQRCIVSVGDSNGVVERSQIRAAAFAAAPLFPYSGITGLNGITISGNVNVGGDLASNQTITLSGNATAGPIVLGPGPNARLQTSGNVTVGSTTTLSSPIVLDPVNPGTSNQSSLSDCPARQEAGYPSCNDDYRIEDGLQSPPVSPYDQSSGNVSFNATTRELSMSGNSSLTLGGGIYNFCNFTQSGNATISIASGAQVEIIIDSPSDPGSGCPSGSGNLQMSGNVTWNNPNANPTSLQIYVFGSSGNNVSISGNSGAIYGVLYAPRSAVSISGNATFYGAIAAGSVSMSGNSFEWDSRASSLTASTTGLYYRTAWAQCSATYQPSSPGAGC
jgi:Tfp pilus assembly protein PilX